MSIFAHEYEHGRNHEHMRAGITDATCTLSARNVHPHPVSSDSDKPAPRLGRPRGTARRSATGAARSSRCRAGRLSSPRSAWKAGLGLTLSLALASPLRCTAAGLDDNVTSLEGTWSSGSGAVSTGLGFFNPVTFEFAVPPTGGISYSFTDDGFWEQSKYIFANDPTHNRCINATLLWQHGTYTFNANGSLLLTPYPSDGHVLVINTCGRKTVVENYYDQPELIPQWSIYLESNTGFTNGPQSAYALQMYADGGDGALGAAMAPLFLQARPPVMLPTQQLHEPVLNG